MKNTKKKRIGLVILALFIPMFIFYVLSEISDTFKTLAYIFLFAVLGVILYAIFSKIKIRIKTMDSWYDKHSKIVFSLLYWNYDKKIKKELDECKYETKRLIQKLGGKCDFMVYDNIEYLVAVHSSGIYAFRFDDVAQKMAGIADDESFVTFDSQYMDIGLNKKLNHSKGFRNALGNILYLNEEDFNLINNWTVHSSYCLYSVLNSADGTFRHFNTKNLADYLKEYFNNPIKVFDNNEIGLMSDLLKEALEY